MFRYKWGYMFNSDEEVVTLVATILPIVALFQVFDGVGAVTAGILRARGKQALGALLNLSAYYIIGIPFGMLLTFKYHYQLLGLWIGLCIALAYSGIVGLWYVWRTDWVKDVERTRERLGGMGENAEGGNGAPVAPRRKRTTSSGDRQV